MTRLRPAGRADGGPATPTGVQPVPLPTEDNRAEELPEVWSFLELVEGRLHDTAPKMASEARRLGRLLGLQACGIAAGSLADGDSATLELARFGVNKVYLATQEGPNGSPAAEAAAEAVSLLVQKHRPSAVLFPATPRGADIGARLAARLRRGLIANCIDFDLQGDRLIARRPISGGKAHLSVRWASPEPYLATIDLDSLEAIAEDVPEPRVTVIREETAVAPARARSLRRWRLPPREIDLTEADFVIGVGRPIDRSRHLESIQTLADRLGATVGGSRVAVFQGTIPPESQIGSSGKWIKPRVYLALGVSGASYHVMGIKGTQHIIAVNSDPGAPIFKLAELGIVADLNEVVSALLDAVKPASGDNHQGT